LAIKPLSAPLPSLCHATPCGSVFRSAGEFGHAVALIGMFQKFFRGINRHVFHVFRLERITNPDVTPKVPSNSAYRENWRSKSASTDHRIVTKNDVQ
jgi:hypothetical protein